MTSNSNARLAEMFVDRSLDDAERNAYSEFGFIRLGRVLTDVGLARMRDECMVAWNAEKEAFDAEKSWLQNSLLADIHHRSPLVCRYYYDGPLMQISQQLIGPNIKGATSQLTFKMRGNTRPFGWHQDNGYGDLEPYNSMTALTALDDADVENGCLWIIPRSHQQGQIDVGISIEDKLAEKSIELEVDESNAIPVQMKAGEAVIFHCWTLHKSEANRSKDRDRRILFLRYADADAVEIYNDRQPRLGPLLCGQTEYAQVESFEADRVRSSRAQ